MTATQRFIEDAIKGGWKTSKNWHKWMGDYLMVCDDGDGNIPVSEILLDPLAWQSVGKTRGWEPYAPYDMTAGEQEYIGEWVERWHEFIDHLADGKSIEEALSKTDVTTN
jgi:hypothetical protein